VPAQARARIGVRGGAASGWVRSTAQHSTCLWERARCPRIMHAHGGAGGALESKPGMLRLLRTLLRHSTAVMECSSVVT